MGTYRVMVRSPDALIYDVEADCEDDAKNKVAALLDKGQVPDFVEDFYFDTEIIDVLELVENQIIDIDEEEVIRARIPLSLHKEFKKYCIDKNTTIQDAIAFMISKVLK